MADIRINSLPSTASSSSSDDFVAIDGATNGTRKLSAYSPTFGGNFQANGTGTIGGALTVSNTITQTGGGNTSLSGQLLFSAAAGQAAGSIARNATYGLTYYGYTGSSNDFTLLNASGTVVLSNPAGTTNTTFAGNFTANGGGTNSLAGNLYVGGGTIGVGGSIGTALDIIGSASDAYVYNRSPGALIFGANNQTVANFGTDKSCTLAGNLTVSGTGTSSVAGTLTTGTTTGNSYLYVTRSTQSQGQVALQLSGGTSGTDWIIYQPVSSNDLTIFGNSANRLTVTSGGNLLLGTTSASGSGKLELATHNDKSGGIGFGTDTALYRGAIGGFLYIDGSSPLLGLAVSGTRKAYVYFNGTNVIINSEQAASSLVFQSSNTTALTLDSSQRCILAGALRLNNAYVSGAPTATGYVTLQDSAGNTYKVLVGT
jgi:hypothetical protein